MKVWTSIYTAIREMVSSPKKPASTDEGQRGGAARLIPRARASRTSESAGYLLLFEMQRVMTRAIGDQPGHPCHEFRDGAGSSRPPFQSQPQGDTRTRPSGRG